MPRSVLLVIGSLDVGGAENQMLMLARGLAGRGIPVTVFTLEKPGPRVAVLRDLGIGYASGGYDRGRALPIRVLAMARCLPRLLRVVRALRPGVLHAWLPLACYHGALAGRLARVPLVVSGKRALGTHQDRHPACKPFERLADRLSHVILANSEAVRLDTAARNGTPLAKIRVIPNGLADGAAAAPDRGALRAGLGLRGAAILCVGNLIPYKGHADLLRGLALHPPAGEWTLLLAGEDRGHGPALRALAAELGLAERVRLLGRRDDVPALLAAADLFVLPSHEEGFSNALLEAMAAGLPCLATAVGGNPEALDGGRLGRLAPPRDPEALGRALAALVVDAPERARLGAAARAAALARYGAAAMVEAHVALYEEGAPRHDTKAGGNPGRGKAWKRSVTWCASLLLGAYLLFPLVAGHLGLGRVNGPRIYPAGHHAFLYRTTYENRFGCIPRASIWYERPWFYGMTPSRRPITGRWKELWDTMSDEERRDIRY